MILFTLGLQDVYAVFYIIKKSATVHSTKLLTQHFVYSDIFEVSYCGSTTLLVKKMKIKHSIYQYGTIHRK